MFQLRNKEPEAVILPKDLGDWEPKNLYPTEYEMDALGARLDSAQNALKHTKPDTWAYTYWTNTVNTLVRRWKRLMVEANVGVQRNLLPETWIVRQDWIEDDYGLDIPTFRIPILESWGEEARLQESLNRSWAKAQEERYQKALTGFV
jgi:hypothetical protein